MPTLPPITLPVPEWMPDQPALNNPGCSVADGVVPRTSLSYGPVGSFVPFATALTARCQGFAAIEDLSGNAYLFAGDKTILYELAGSATAFSDVSTAGSGPYNIPDADYWPIVAFGNRIIASNITDGMQTFLLLTDTKFTALGGGSPKAKYLLVVKDFLVAANTSDAGSGAQPMRVWWSAIGNPGSWPTPGTTSAIQVQSDYQDMIGDYGTIVGIVGPLGAADAAIVMERGIWRMQYAGSPAIFDFSLAAGAHGSQAPESLVLYQNRLYYLGDDDFYVFDGIQIQPIGSQKWARFFWDSVDRSFLNRVHGDADPLSKLIVWGYPTIGSNGVITDVVAYNWYLNRASHFKLDAEWIQRSLNNYSATLDSLGVIDNLPFPLDFYHATNAPILAVFDPSHRLGFLQGPPLAANVETSETQLFPGRRARYGLARPLVDGGAPAVALAVRDRIEDMPVYKTPVRVNRLGACPQRSTGRYVRASISLAAGSSFQHIQGVDLDATPEGIR